MEMTRELTDYRTNYRPRMLAIGQAFQDFIMRRLYAAGTVLNTLASPSGQTMGENLLGMEIKRDGHFNQTGNLYIEIAEKAVPRAGDYVPSGIYRNDNSWLFGIGDEVTFFIFAIQTLRRAHATGRYRSVEKDTSRGFLFPVAEAAKCAARIFHFSNTGGIEKVEIGCEDQTGPVLHDMQRVLFG